MKTFVYIIYNALFILVSIWILFYANTYINAKIVPDRFRWKDGHIREDMTLFGISLLVILIVEAASLVFANYKINRWYVGSFMGNDQQTTWAGTLCVLLVILVFIGIINAAAYR